MKILCPTRGGEASYSNQDKAIEIAAERGCTIVFLYVSNINFLLNLRSPMLAKNIQDDLDDMGEFLLTIAQERAEKKNVKAEIILKHGGFYNALKEVIEEEKISTLLIGSSVDEKGYTTTEYLENLVGKIREISNVEIFITNQGEVVKHETAEDSPPEI
jgi:nucleotide-binding universal stress UspA family protein